MAENTISMRRMQSPHRDARRDATKPSYIILHYTGTHTAQEAEEVYIGASAEHKARPVSPHFMIDVDGSITQFVDEVDRAWHAGVSWWRGITDMNSHSVGIELVNPGHEKGYRIFPVQQIHALIGLCRDIMGRHAIPSANVLGHSDIAPARKTDPGELLDWRLLAMYGIGLWPQPESDDYDSAMRYLSNRRDLNEALSIFGYDPSAPFESVISAFQRHFQPDIFSRDTAQRQGLLDHEGAARLAWLVRGRH